MISKKNRQDPKYINKFNELYCIKMALDHCIFVKDFFDDSFDLKLTKTGERLFKHLKKRNLDVNDSILYFAIFRDFYHNDIYFELNDVNEITIVNKISEFIKKEYIKFPWVFGRELYDRYFDEFDNQTEYLDYDETIYLLNGTSRGVFQIDNIIISPFGLLYSKVKRNIRPKLEFHLYHCSDPSCPAFHLVELDNSDDNVFVKLSKEIENYNSNKDAIDITDLIPDFEYEFYDPYSLEGLYDLLVNSFGTKEIKQIAEAVINQGKLREFLPKEIVFGSTKEICNLLTKNECFSLILLCDDLTILECIDSLINDNIIKIPSTEIRESFSQRRFGHYETYLQCNKLGVRVTTDYKEASMIKLKNLVKYVYSDSSLKDQLDWNLRGYDSKLSTSQKLDEYLNNHTPLEVIKEMIFNGPRQLTTAIQSISGMTLKDINSNEDILIKKIVWKLGFDINIHPSYLNDFWINFKDFKTVVLQSQKYNEDDKLKLRASSVNLFVSIEDILQQSLALTTWALLSDHYLDTRFKYIYENARDFMINELDNHQLSKDLIIKFDRSGKNTLFPLINGFRALLDKCDSILSNPLIYKRHTKEFPSYYFKDPLIVFPFEHKKFILDILEQDYYELKENIKFILSEFGKGEIIEIRNKLQHNREDFPTQEELIKSLNHIESVFSLIENESICPNVYLFKKSLTDEYNRISVTLENYKGTSFQYFFSIELNGSHIPTPYYHSLLKINPIKLKDTNHPLVFSYKEKSSYQEYWQDYPRKKPKE